MITIKKKIKDSETIFTVLLFPRVFFGRCPRRIHACPAGLHFLRGESVQCQGRFGEERVRHTHLMSHKATFQRIHQDVHMFALPCWRAFITRHELYLVEVTYCTFELRVRKPTYILTNSKAVAQALKPHFCQVRPAHSARPTQPLPSRHSPGRLSTDPTHGRRRAATTNNRTRTAQGKTCANEGPAFSRYYLA